MTNNVSSTANVKIEGNYTKLYNAITPTKLVVIINVLACVVVIGTSIYSFLKGSTPADVADKYTGAPDVIPKVFNIGIDPVFNVRFIGFCTPPK